MKKIFISFCITLFYFAGNAQVLNNFENWHNFTGGLTTLSIPNGWNATDSLICTLGFMTNPIGQFVPQVSKEQPGAGASATAIKVETKNQAELTGFINAGPMPCMATNSQINVDINNGDLSFIGGTPCMYDPVYATLWVKNNPINGDSTSITILALDNSDGDDSLVCYADTVLGATINTFTQITLPFKGYNPNYSTTQLRVLISSSLNFDIDTLGFFTGLNNGTWIAVDDIEVAAPNGVVQYILSSKKANIYPTLVTDKLNVNLQANDKNIYQFSLFDIQGKKVRSFSINKELNVLDMQNMPAGNYIYNLSLQNQSVQTGKISVK
ncbi:MAG: T9SS type A sorting domain-containing protein [Chitinophagaceae bacterium]|mgnify:CR=1 FL=1|nr:MAG: hypothetical protein UZ11_BCD004000991 [Bacteroidetes bacterium OLB11]MCC6448829.1 T9SS type A sorting domain-containing protein [Chitinophagaceae bacterium]HMN33055.1 T9SS type A sorting domain-containing protein [Chitinophagaceae bacterium]